MLVRLIIAVLVLALVLWGLASMARDAPEVSLDTVEGDILMWKLGA
jgi:hypothetical protein